MIARRRVVRINRPLRTPEVARRAPRLRIGLLGGSFNPAHAGHLAISLEAIKQLRLDQVWWLVAPQNPLKREAEMADFGERMASAEALAAGHPGLVVTDLEQRLGTSYSIDTVRWLKRRCRARFVWLMGADNLAQLPYWRGWRQLVELVPIAVVDREPYSYRALAGRMAQRYAARRRAEGDAPRLAESPPPAWVYLRLRRQKASSTAVRQARASTRRRPGAKERAS
jgi:nicotinate-nucleotide adenylyltransferase